MRTAVTLVFVSLGVGLAGALARPAQKSASVIEFAVVDRFKIGGEGGWDCLSVDSEAHRLYVSRGTHVMVVDTETGKVAGDIPNTPGVHDIAIDVKRHKGFVSCGREDSVLVFDTTTLKESGRVKVGKNPDIMLFDSSTNQVLSFNGGSSDVTVVDATTNEVKGTLAMGGKPEFARSDGKGHVFVNLEDSSKIVEFDAKSLKLVRSWSLAPAEGPTGLAFDTKHGLLYSACGNNMMAVSDAKAGKLLSTAKIGNGPDGAGFDPALGLVFAPNGSDGTVTVLKCGPGSACVPVQEVSTQKSARTMAVDTNTHRLYLIAAEFEAPAAGQRRGKMVPDSAVILVVGPKK